MEQNIFFQISLGRIGNIMFHLAAAKEYSKKSGRKPYIVYHETFRDYYKSLKYGPFQSFDIVSDDEMHEMCKGKQMKQFFNKGVDDYNPTQLCNEDEIPVFCGWRFNPKYFSRETALELFKPNDDIIDFITKVVYPDIPFSKCVSINIRRGDFLIFKDPYVVSSKLFYDTVLSKFPKDQKYVVTSDDIQWCKQNFKGDNFYFIDRNTRSDVFSKMFVDLYVAGLCKHNIISNSTFSWWGAYLNQTPGRKVYFQAPWLSDGNGMTIVPENDNWIPIKKDVYIMNNHEDVFHLLFSVMCGIEYAKKNGMQAHLVNDKAFAFKPEINRLVDIVDSIDYTDLGNVVYSNETLENVFTELPQEKFLTHVDSVVINGMRMSPKYFNRDFVISKLEVLNGMETYAKILYNNIGEFSEWVSLSIEDFDMDFIHKALEMFPHEKVFVISSDIEKAKSLLGDKFTYLDKKTALIHPLVEFYAQKLAKSCIISNTVRDWWGAYLNNNPGRKVVYKAPFLDNQNPQYNKMNDIIPQENNWIGI